MAVFLKVLSKLSPDSKKPDNKRRTVAILSRKVKHSITQMAGTEGIFSYRSNVNNP
jgi:hypothetical protein